MEFIFKFPPPNAGTTFTGIRGVSCLHHKVFDITVNQVVIVVATSTESKKILGKYTWYLIYRGIYAVPHLLWGLYHSIAQFWCPPSLSVMLLTWEKDKEFNIDIFKQTPHHLSLVCLRTHLPFTEAAS